MSEPDVCPEDALQVAQRALAKVNDLEQELADLRKSHDEALDDIAALELRLSELDDNTDYRDLSQDRKVGMVREHAFKKAVDGHGRASLTYDDVKWGVFEGQPGNSQCYRLLRRAAGYDNDGNCVQDVPGFDLDESSRPMKLTVNAEAAKRGAAFSSRNKTGSGEVL
ncbi:hypothetical protein [Halosolutus halophilus]|uniref:hypothetical protein n=1 Tax=Halosolutus halophilus TaxID=1552990 RepID=UPI0022352377|nr:hypothetical protein [Halosolutus halophilus]